MEIQETRGPPQQTITAIGADGVVINGKKYSQSLLLLPDALPEPWKIASFEALLPEDLFPVGKSGAELLIVGTGRKQRFPSPEIMARIAENRAGVEYMTSHAACRTFNLLLSEGRRIALALYMETDA